MSDPRIVAAAILIDGVIHTQPAPARHHDIIRQYVRDTGKRVRGDAVQGFLTSAGEFAPRRTSAILAMRAGQITRPKWPPNLFSEDLW